MALGTTLYALSAPTVPGPPPHEATPTTGTPVPAPAPTTPTQAPTAPTPPPSLPAPNTPPKVQAESAILVDAVSGQVLYEKNADKPRPIASTTKIMTALLFVESVPELEILTASKYASQTKESSLHLTEGERIESNDLLHAILLRSANDGCVVAAERVAGTEAAFVERMNQRAQALGATQTHFMNPHGLHHKLHYSSARDLALIARAAMQNPRIRDVVGKKRYRISRSLNQQDVWVTNHSKFLGKFPGADGVKTGWTNPAGKCYVGSVTQNDWRLISVVLKTNDYVQDTTALMKFGFAQFAPVVVAREGDAAGVCEVKSGVKTTVPIQVQQRVQVVANKGELPAVEQRRHLLPVTAPVAAGQPLGTLEAVLDGKVISTSALVATESCSAVPRTSQRGRLLGKILLAGIALSGLGLVSLRYGTHNRNRFAAFAKSARRRRRRLTQSLRSPDSRG